MTPLSIRHGFVTLLHELATFSRNRHNRVVAAVIRPIRASLLVLTALVLLAAPAGAHAEIRESDPSAGGTAPTGQDEVTITFISMDAEVPAQIDVLDAAGDSIVTAEVTIVETTPMGTVVAVPVAPLEEGRHVVTWEAMSSDGDGLATGSFEFVAEERSAGGLGIWLLWIAALAIPVAFLLRAGANRRRSRP